MRFTGRSSVSTRLLQVRIRLRVVASLHGSDPSGATHSPPWQQLTMNLCFLRADPLPNTRLRKTSLKPGAITSSGSVQTSNEYIGPPSCIGQVPLEHWRL